LPRLSELRLDERLQLRHASVIATWGSSPAERVGAYSCDELIECPDGVVFRAVDIAAPAALVFRWLCQLRVAPYSYDWIDNRRARSPRQLTEGLDRLEVGQRFMRIFRLTSFVDGESITLDSTTSLFGRVVGTYVVVPAGIGRSRLVVKLAFAARAGFRGWIVRRFLPAGDLFMMRKQLLTLKRLAERDAKL
jgi:hypothetical protein